MNLFFYKFGRFIPFALIALVFFLTDPAQAQMFSVEEDEPGPSQQFSTTGVYIGLEPTEFTYKGGTSVEPNRRGLYEFNGSMLRLRLETTGLEAFLGVAGRLTGLDTIAYFEAGAKAGGNLRLFRSPVFIFRIPLKIKTTINNASNSENLSTTTEFRQGTLQFGGGGEIGVRLDDQIWMRISAIPNYGFSFATGGTFGGDIFDLEAGSRLYIDRLFGDLGLSAGIDYTFKRFDIEENEFDYNFRSFSFLLGITF